MKKTKKVIALGLTAVMALSLSACGETSRQQHRLRQPKEEKRQIAREARPLRL